MNKRRNVLVVLVLICVVLSGISGCKNQVIDTGLGVITKEELDPEKIGDYGKLKLPLDTNGTTISAIAISDVTTDNESIVINELRRRTGINLQVIAIPTSTAKEKAKVLLASKNNMPDIFPPVFPNVELNDFGVQGAFEPINTHLDELPNFNEIFYQKAKEYKTVGKLNNLKASDGNLYIFPQYDKNRDVNHGMLYRKDIFDKHGLTLWNNAEEFYQTLKKLKELYPSSIPMVSKTGTVIFRDIGYSWGLNGFNPYYDEETKMWKYSSIDPKYKEMLDFLKKLYDEGLMDPEFLTCTQSAWTAKMTQADKAFVTWDWIGRMDLFKEQTAETVPEFDLRYAYPIGPTGKLTSSKNVVPGPTVKKGPNSVLVMKLLDYLISESGARLMTMGIEGVTYEKDPDGYANHNNFIDEVIAGDALEQKFGLFINGLSLRFDRKSSYFKFTEREKEAQDIMLNKNGGGFLPEDPEPIFTEEERELISQYLAGISKAAEEFSTQYILTDKTGDAAWNAWLAKAESLGASKVINVYNEAQKRFDAM